MEQHVVSIGDCKPVLVMEAVGCALDQREEALAPRRNVRAVLNVVRRPETLRSGVVPLVEKRFEGLQPRLPASLHSPSRYGKLLGCAMPGSPARKPQGLTGSDIPSS